MTIDKQDRCFEVLRVSVTKECNFRCFYCDDSSRDQQNSFVSSLSPDGFSQMIDRLNTLSPLKSVRLTGGEPLLYKPIVTLVSRLKEMGIPKVHLTTNGSRLKDLAKDLKKAGLDSINISLDAINPELFKKMSGQQGSIEKVISGIEEALECNFPIKLNSTLLKGVNDSELLPLFRFAGEKKVAIRFLELMKMGHLYHHYREYLYPREEILRRLSQSYSITPLPRKSSSTAEYWITQEGQKFGIIANESSPFCHDCNRLRLDHTGKIYGCLSVNNGFQINESIEDFDLQEVLSKAMSQKQVERFIGSTLSMKAIGG